MPTNQPPVPTDISPELRAFLAEWLDWAENGAPPHDAFSKSAGLCSCALWWEGSLSAREDLLAFFGDDCYPFGGKHAYYDAVHLCTQHLDPNRLAWVRATLAANPET